MHVLVIVNEPQIFFVKFVANFTSAYIPLNASDLIEGLTEFPFLLIENEKLKMTERVF